jgi:hypothetical protein
MPAYKHNGTALKPERFIEIITAFGYFEGYSKLGQKNATEMICKRLQYGLKHKNRYFYERWPGLALRSCVLLLTDDWLKEDIISAKEGSFGLFKPSKIQQNWKDRDFSICTFVHAKKTYTCKAPYYEIVWKLYELIQKVMKSDCNGVKPQQIIMPDGQPCSCLAFSTDKAFKALLKSGLVPKDPGDFGYDDDETRIKWKYDKPEYEEI